MAPGLVVSLIRVSEMARAVVRPLCNDPAAAASAQRMTRPRRRPGRLLNCWSKRGGPAGGGACSGAASAVRRGRRWRCEKAGATPFISKNGSVSLLSWLIGRKAVGPSSWTLTPSHGGCFWLMQEFVMLSDHNIFMVLLAF